MTVLSLLIKRLFCKHDYRWLVNLHGDPIHYYSTWRKFARSIWSCEKCGKLQYREQLYNVENYLNVSQTQSTRV
jgi:RNase P subunit RPR2